LGIKFTKSHHKEFEQGFAPNCSWHCTNDANVEVTPNKIKNIFFKKKIKFSPFISIGDIIKPNSKPKNSDFKLTRSLEKVKSCFYKTSYKRFKKIKKIDIYLKIRKLLLDRGRNIISKLHELFEWKTKEFDKNFYTKL